MRSRWLYISFLFLICKSLTAQSSLAADYLYRFDGTRPLRLYDNLLYYEDEQQLSIETIGTTAFQDNFRAFDPTQILQKGKIYWFKLSIDNQYDTEKNGDRFYLETPIFSEYIDIYIYDDDQDKYLKRVGESYRPFTVREDAVDWLFFGGIVEEIPILQQDTLTLFVKVQPELDWQFSKQGEVFQLTNLEYVEQNKFGLGYKIIIYIGFMIMMIIYSLGLYFLIRESAYLYYALFAFSILAYNASIFQLTYFIVPYLFPNHPEYELLFRLFIYVGFFSFLFFCKDYLELKKYLLRWNSIFKVVGLAALGFLLLELAFIFFSDRFPWNWSSDYISRLPYIVIPFVLTIAIFIIPSFRLPSNKKWFLLAGILSLILSAIYVLIHTLVNHGINANSFFVLLIGSAAELVIFALGLAYRIKESEAEKQKAYVQLEEAEIIKVQRDEIAEKNAQNELLLKEIHHRVKNNLETVSSLLELQSAQVEDEEVQSVMQASQSRVQSMSILHQKLYQGDDLASIEMKDYFKNLAEGLLDTYDAWEQVEIEYDMSKIELDVDTAVPIGLIVNELLTNTLKYAFPDGEKGKVYLSLQQKETKGLQLIVADNGIGKTATAPSQGTGFGSQLVNLLTRQLGGTMREENGDGMKVIFEFGPVHHTK